jgi:hypothetical protein
MPLSRNPEEVVSRGMYRAMVEQRDEARAERDRYREALETVMFHHDISGGALDYLREALDG